MKGSSITSGEKIKNAILSTPFSRRWTLRDEAESVRPFARPQFLAEHYAYHCIQKDPSRQIIVPWILMGRISELLHTAILSQQTIRDLHRRTHTALEGASHRHIMLVDLLMTKRNLENVRRFIPSRVVYATIAMHDGVRLADMSFTETRSTEADIFEFRMKALDFISSNDKG